MIKSGIRKKIAEVGKIKIGGKGKETTSKNGKKFSLPVKYDHFVVTTTERASDGNFVVDNAVMQRLGKNPKRIKIRLLFDDIDLNFNTSFAWYQGALCMCRGDGETAERLFTKSGKPKTCEIIDGPETVSAGEKRRIKCNPETCPLAAQDDKGTSKCKPSGILSCIIDAAPQVGGVYRFRTHSWNTVAQVLGSLEFIKTLTGGILAGIPMVLQIVKKATEAHGNVTTVAITVDAEDYVKTRELAFREAENRNRFAIDMSKVEKEAKNTGFLIDTDDPEDVSAEFYTTDDTAKEKKETMAAASIADRATLITQEVIQDGAKEHTDERTADTESAQDDPGLVSGGADRRLEGGNEADRIQPGGDEELVLF